MLARTTQRVKMAVNEKLLVPLRQLTLVEIVVSCGVGVLGGVFPIPMVTTVVTLLLAKVLHCNAPQVMLSTTANFICTPLQIVMIPVFARVMALLSRGDPSGYTTAALKASLEKGYGAFFASSSTMLLYATIAWCLFAGAAMLALRVAQRYVVTKRR